VHHLRPTDTTLVGDVIIGLQNSLFTAVSRIGLWCRSCGFRCSCPTSTKKGWKAIPPFSGRLVQPRKVSQITKAASVVGMASLFELDGLVGGHRANLNLLHTVPWRTGL
jgi:hypothetical protein